MAIHLQRELDKLKRRVLSLGAQVEERVRMAAEAIDSQDLSEAEQIIRSDYLIDQEEVEIEEECLKILALHQPVAVDLRFLAATIKINSDLERIADEAVNIAHRLKEMIKHRNGCTIQYDYSKLIQDAQSMLRKSLDSLVNLDVDVAFKVLILDDAVDAENRRIYESVTTDMKSNCGFEEYLMNNYLISRHIERIADHATNIAEEVIYLIEGEIIRHGKY